MKKSSFYYLFFGCLFCYFSVFSQSTIKFNVAYPIFPGYGCYGTSVNITTGGYIITGETADSNSHTDLFIAKIDTMGSLLWIKTYNEKEYEFLGSLLNGGEGISIPWGGGLTTASLLNDSTGYYNWGLFRFDGNGDTIWTKNYQDSANFQVDQVILTRNNQYLVGGNWVTFGRSVFYAIALIKTDSLGNEVWVRTYNGNGHSRYYGGVDTCLDGGYIISGEDYDTTAYCTGRIFIIKTDSSGNALWIKYISGSPCNMGAWSVLSLNDGGYLVAGYNDSVSSFPFSYPLLYLIKFSSSGDSIWSKEYGSPAPPDEGDEGLSSILETKNGDIITCGVGLNDSSIKGWILDVDSNGNQKWFKYYTKFSPTDENVLGNLQLTPDGGCIAAGYTDTPEDFWVVKTDSLGCDTIGCGFLSGEKQMAIKNEELKVYPNPTSGIATLVVSDRSSVVSKMQVEVFNVFGQKVYSAPFQLPPSSSTCQINLSSQPEGVYFYRVFNEEGASQSLAMTVVGSGKIIIEK